MNEKLRQKILRDLETKEYVTEGGRVFFLSISGYPVSHPQQYFFKKREELRRYFSSEYFSDKKEREREHLVLENLSLFASPLEKDDLSQMKAELVYQSAFCEVWKFSNYPQRYDGVDFQVPRIGRELESPRQEVSEWQTERNNWLTEFTLKIRDKIRRELAGSD